MLTFSDKIKLHHTESMLTDSMRWFLPRYYENVPLGYLFVPGLFNTHAVLFFIMQNEKYLKCCVIV